MHDWYSLQQAPKKKTFHEFYQGSFAIISDEEHDEKCKFIKNYLLFCGFTCHTT